MSTPPAKRRLISSSAAPWNLRSVLSVDDGVEASHLAFVLLDDDGSYVDANVTFLDWMRNLPFAPDSISEWFSMVREDGTPFPVADRPTAVALRTGQAVSNVVMGLADPGAARRWLLVSAAPATYDGHPRGVLATCRDITEKIEAEQLVRLTGVLAERADIVVDETVLLQQTCESLVQSGRFALARVAVASSVQPGVIADIVSVGEPRLFRPGSDSWLETSPLGAAPTAIALRDGLTSVHNDLLSVPSMIAWRERIRESGLRAAIAIPFSLHGTRAVLNVLSYCRDAFDPDTRVALEHLTRELEFAVNQIQPAPRLAEGLADTMRTLTQMTAAHDPFQGSPPGSVGRLASELARRMGFNEHERLLVAHAGAVVNIGMITVPPAIVARHGELSAAETHTLESHTVAGYEILSKAALPWPIAEVALQHHEHLDGTGYPYGITADQISMPVRIVALAAEVAAMSRARPPRSRLDAVEVLAAVRARSGTWFDADVVDAYTAAFADGFTFDDDTPRQAVAAAAPPR